MTLAVFLVSRQRRVATLERQLGEEKRRVQAAEKKLKMVDVPLSEVKDDVRLRQHEKEILQQEVRNWSDAVASLCPWFPVFT